MRLSQVSFLGFVPRAQLPGLYACLDVVLFPSMTKFETFGIVNTVRSGPILPSPRLTYCYAVQEAMLMGVPIVHYGVGGVQV